MSDIKEKIRNVIDFFQKVGDVTFDGDRYIVPVSQKKVLEHYNIPFEEYGNELRIMLKVYFRPYLVKYAPILNSEIVANDVNSDFVAFDLPAGFVYYKAEDELFETFGTASQDFVKKVRNTVAYFQFFTYLKSSEFCDYFNAANNEIIIYNSNNGVQRITFETVPFLDSIIVNTEIAVKKLLDFARPLEFRFFFQNATYILGGSTGTTKLIDIINEYIKIIAITQRDYQLVSKKFSFDNFQNGLIKEKNKYFNSIRDVLAKVANQAVGIPISIGATVFTSYKVTGDLMLLMLLLLTFFLYLYFYWKFQNFYKSDINEVRRDFNRDFEKIKANSGLMTAEVESERNAIVNRLDRTESIIRWLKITVLGLGLVVTIFIIKQMF